MDKKYKVKVEILNSTAPSKTDRMIDTHAEETFYWAKGGVSLDKVINWWESRQGLKESPTDEEQLVGVDFEYGQPLVLRMTVDEFEQLLVRYGLLE